MFGNKFHVSTQGEEGKTTGKVLPQMSQNLRLVGGGRGTYKEKVGG